MSTEKAIKAHVDAFVRDLTAMIRESALETVHAALGESVAKKRGPGRPRGSRNATTTTTRRRSGKRIRRSSEDVAALGSEIASYVAANDGCSISDIGAAVGASTKDLRLPVLKLIADRAIRTSGQKRGTRYHAGGRGPAKKATRKKAARKKKIAKRGTKKGRVSKKRASGPK